MRQRNGRTNRNGITISRCACNGMLTRDKKNRRAESYLWILKCETIAAYDLTKCMSTVILYYCNDYQFNHGLNRPTLISHLAGRYRQDCAKRKLPVLNLLTWPKIRFICPAGATRCADSCETWHGRREVDPLGVAKFHLNRRRGWECDPKI